MTMLTRTLTLLLCLMALAATAQPDLPTDNVEVVRDFEAQLEEAQRLPTAPTLPALDTTSVRLTYNVQPYAVRGIEYAAPTLRPLPMKPDPLPEAYTFYGRLGYGTLSMPYAELDYHMGRADNYAFGARGKYYSMSGDLPNQEMSLLDLDLDGTYYLESGLGVSGRLGFESEGRNFYAVNFPDTLSDGTPVSEDIIEQRFTTIDLGVQLFNSSVNVGDINYKVGLDFYRLGDSYDAAETGVNAYLDATKYTEANHELNLVVRNDFANFNDTASQGNNVLTINPSYVFKSEAFYLRGGLNLVLDQEDFRFFPDVEAGYDILKGQVVAFVGWAGDVHRNTYRNLTDYNPFLRSTLDIDNTAINHIYGGVRGKITGLTYELVLGNKSTDNLAVFLNDTTSRRFDVAYDDANIFNVHANLEWAINKQLQFFGAVDFNTYSMDSLAAAFHLPYFYLNTGVRYQLLENRLRLNASLTTMDGVDFLASDGSIGETDGLVDVNLGGEYWFTPKVAAFVQLNNVTNNTRERWVNYPNLGFNALFGVTAKF